MMLGAGYQAAAAWHVMVDGHPSHRQPCQQVIPVGLVSALHEAGWSESGSAWQVDRWTLQSFVGTQAGAPSGPGFGGVGRRLVGISRQAGGQLLVGAVTPSVSGLLLAGSPSDLTAALQCLRGRVVRATRCADVSSCAVRQLDPPPPSRHMPVHAKAAGPSAGN